MFLQPHKVLKEIPRERGYEGVKDFAKMFQRIPPISLLDGEIIDGYLQYKAACELELEVNTRDVEGNPYELLWNFNQHRSDWRGVQRYLIWWYCYRKADRWYADQQRLQGKSGYIGLRPGAVMPVNSQRRVSIEDCFKLAGVTPSAVQIGDRLLRKAPDLAEEVRMDRMSPAEAMRRLKGGRVTIDPAQ